MLRQVLTALASAILASMVWYCATRDDARDTGEDALRALAICDQLLGRCYGLLDATTGACDRLASKVLGAIGTGGR